MQSSVRNVVFIQSSCEDVEDVWPSGEHQGLGLLILSPDPHQTLEDGLDLGGVAALHSLQVKLLLLLILGADVGYLCMGRHAPEHWNNKIKDNQALLLFNLNIKEIEFHLRKSKVMDE